MRIAIVALAMTVASVTGQLQAATQMASPTDVGPGRTSPADTWARAQVDARLVVEDTPGQFDAAGLEEAEVRAFFNAFQEGILSGRADRVVNLIEFPLRVNGCNRTNYIKRKDFNRRFSSVFDAQISNAIKEQTFETLAASWRGVMIGDHGEVWFEGICEGSTKADPCPKYRIRVVAVNKGCP